jgi:hypothetical protein
VRVIAWPRPWLALLECRARELQRVVLVGEVAKGQGDQAGEAGCGQECSLPLAARQLGWPAAMGECWVRLVAPSDDTTSAEATGLGAEAAAARSEASRHSWSRRPTLQPCLNPAAVQTLTLAVASTLEPEPEPSPPRARVGTHLEPTCREPTNLPSYPPTHPPTHLPEAAVSVLRDLSNRLRQRDPESRVEAAPDGDSGRFVINSVRYNSRVLRWLGKVDGDTDVFALQRVVQSSLSPCPLYDMKNHVTSVAH